MKLKDVPGGVLYIHNPAEIAGNAVLVYTRVKDEGCDQEVCMGTGKKFDIVPDISDREVLLLGIFPPG